MLFNVMDGMEYYGSSYSNWAKLHLNFSTANYTIKIKGEFSKDIIMQFKSEFLPHSLIQNIYDDEENHEILICDMGSCLQPFKNFEEVTHFLKIHKQLSNSN
jgi:hypothetical protein